MLSVPRPKNLLLQSSVPSMLTGFPAVDARLPAPLIPTLDPLIQTALAALTSLDSTLNTPTFRTQCGYTTISFATFYKYVVDHVSDPTVLTQLATARSAIISLCLDPDFYTVATYNDFLWNLPLPS